jgi:DNA modification methylase
MAQLNLNDEDLKKLAQSINDSSEPPYELIEKLFPSFIEKMRQDGKLDVEALNRYKIPTIEYAGKRSEGLILASASLLGEAAPLQILRNFGEGEEKDWKNLIVQGDNLQFLKTVYLNQDPLIKDKVKGKVKLIYIDPPFGTGDEYGGSDGEMSYSAKLKGAEFIENLRERLIFLREILADDGCIFMRIDYRFGHYLKIILDEIFNKNNFKNEIVINRSSRPTEIIRQYHTAHDVLFFYSKSLNYYFKNFEKTREIIKWRAMHLPGIRWTTVPNEYLPLYSKDNLVEKGEKYVTRARVILGKELLPPNDRHWAINQEDIFKLEKEGKIKLNKKNNPLAIESNYIKIADNWTDIQGYSQFYNYPTENSEELLERVILTSTEKPDDIVVDVFAGYGTTAAVAEKFGRRWIMCDFGKHAIYTMQKRIFNISESKALGEENKNKRYGKPPKPFSIVSAGAYDFTRIMDLRNNKKSYISFVLSLFGIPKEDKDYIEKYKLDNIYAEKDGDPVEIFPVWEDEYLYNIRIDEDYLKEIIVQTKGRLKGNYFIVVPETCTLISNTKMNNNSGDEIYFNLLKFPYKILEEVSRNFAIEEQPDSPQNINSLVSSVGFYFNDEVKVELVKINGGFKVNKFNTVILNKEKQQYEGLKGLSLLLIDLNYDGKVFNIDKAVYQKELKIDGIVEIDGIGSLTAVIAIDKFGNESHPTFIIER